MRKNVSLLLQWCLILFLGVNLHAQVNISLSVAPPYPIHLEDLLQLEGQVVMTITNQTAAPVQLKLLATVEGNNGIKVTTKPGFIPTMPLVMTGNQTMVLTGAQLRSLNSNLTENDISISGVSVRQLVQTEQLPEGLYTICVRAYNYQTGVPMSPEMSGCSPINITWYDPPILTWPTDNTFCAPQTPQFQLFNWTPSGVPGKTRYRFELVDMSLNNLANPNDAFINPAIQPSFKQENIFSVSLAYDLSKPALVKGHRYAWRVTAYDPTNSISFKNGGKSEVWSFRYDVNQGGGFVGGPGVIVSPPNQQYNLELFDDMPPGACLGDVSAEAHPNQVLATNIGQHDSIKIGNFFIRNVNMNFTGSGYTGTGTIKVNFLHAAVKVEFNNLKINAERHVVGDSKVIATVDVQNLYDASLSNNVNGIIDLTTAQLQQIETVINQPGRLVSALNGAVQGMPLGLDNNKYNIAVVGLIFTPTESFMNAVLGTPVPEAFSGDYLCFSMKKIGIHPNGFAANVKMSLAKDIEVALSNFSGIKFIKGASTFAEFDCAGFKSMNVKGEMYFSRERVLPIDAQGKVIADVSKRVTAGFTVEAAEKLSAFIAQTTLSHDFVIPEAQNLPFKRPNQGQQTPDLVLDFSDKANAPGFNAAFPGKPASWQGVYFKGLEITLPEQFKKSGNVLKLAIQNLFIDKTGITVNVDLEGEILKASNGEVAGLGLNINQLGIGIAASKLTGASMTGSVVTPLSSSAIGYECVIAKGQNNNVDFSIGINNIPGLSIDMWLATADIQEISHITIAKEGNKWGATVDLTGSLTININKKENNNAGVEKFEMPGLNFEHLVVKTAEGTFPKLEAGVLELDNINLPQIKLAGFEVTLDEITLTALPNNSFGLTLPLSLTLLGQDNGGEEQNNANTVSAGTQFMIVGKLTNKSFTYDHMELQEIYINSHLGPVHIWGGLAIYSGDQKYGNGFRAKINGEIESIGLQIGITTQFGKVNSMKYLYVDAMIKLPTGIPVPGTTVSIYGFGGGFWYNMAPKGIGMKTVGIDEYNKSGKEGLIGGSESGVVYEPLANKIGFKASVAFGISGGKEAAQVFNGDLEFSMQLDYADMSLDYVKLDGKAFLMQSFTDRSNGAVKMTALIEIVPEQKLFHGLFSVDVNIAKGTLTGGGELEIKFDGKNEKWFIKAGKWNPDYADLPWTDPDRINIALNIELGSVVDLNIAFFAYFMIGNDIPNGLPPIPGMIYDNLPALKKPQGGPNKEIPASVSGGTGIALGVGVHVDISVEVLFFYAKAEMLLGADIVLLKNAIECDNNGGDYGVNAWYASGQAYAYLGGEAGLHLDVWFWEGYLPLIELKTGAVLKAEMPNPVWMKGDFAIYGSVLGGLIKVNTSVSFEVGDKCTPNNGAFGDYPMIAEIKPAHNATNIDHFTNPSIAFNFDREKSYELVVGDKDSKVMMMVNDNDIVFERKSGNSWVKVEGVIHWNKAENGVAFVPKEMLATDTDYRLKVKAMGNEIREGKNQPSVFEEKFTVFHTKKTAPDKIPWHAVQTAFPYPRQRFHTYNSVNGDGWIKTGMGVGQIINKPTPAACTQKIVARFTELETGKKIDKKASYNEYDGLTYTIPYTEMKRSQIYRLDILRIITPIMANNNLAMANTGANGPKVKSVIEVMKELEATKKKLDGSNSSMKGAIQLIIGGIYFKTSKYAGMTEKLYACKVKKSGYVNEFYDSPGEIGGASCPVAFLNVDESFDGYDLNGYQIPLVGTDPEDNLYYQEAPILSFNVTEPTPWLQQQRHKYFTTLQVEGPWVFYNVKIREQDEPQHLKRWYTDSDVVPKVFRDDNSLPFYGQPQETFWEVMQFVNSQGMQQELRENGSLTNTETLLKPAPPLSNAEIAAAKAKAAEHNNEDLNGGSIFNFANNNGGNGGGIQNQALDLNLSNGNNGKQYFAIVDYRTWLANADWGYCRAKMIKWSTTAWDNHPQWITPFAEKVNGMAKPGYFPKGSYSFNIHSQMNNVGPFTYQIK